MDYPSRYRWLGIRMTIPGVDAALIGTAAKAAPAVLTFIKDATSFLAQSGRKGLDKLSVDLEVGFKKYLDRNYKKLSSIKTLLNPSQSIKIESTYVSPNLLIADKKYNEDQFLSFMEDSSFVAVTAVGGAGKSVFLKHIFIRYYNESRGRIPVFVELRNMPKDGNLIEFIRSHIFAISPRFDEELFLYALGSGKFLFLLDGFDEIDPLYRQEVSKQLLGLTYKFDDNLYLISSRPDDEIDAWPEFHTAELIGFTKRQVISLLSKTKFDIKIKREFTKLITDGNLYETHGSYLANPLLCSIMLLTFNVGGDIPLKMHLFFALTFDVLFNRHDAQKDISFKRKSVTGFALDDFKEVMSSFSFASYLDHGPSMTESDAREHAQTALNYCRKPGNADDFITDMCSALSILIKEGGKIYYVHRTFQEYFVSYFLSMSQIAKWEEIITHIINDRSADSVISMMRDINGERFDNDYLEPMLARLQKKMNEIDIRSHPIEAFKLFFLDLHWKKEKKYPIYQLSWLVGSTGIPNPPFRQALRFVRDGEGQAELESFDWFAHFSKHGVEILPARDFYQVNQMTNELFAETPIVGYLQSLKKNIKELHEKLEKSRLSRDSIISSSILKRI